MKILIPICLVFVKIVIGVPIRDINYFNDTVCDNIPEFSKELQQRIDSLEPDVNRIINFVLNDQRGVTCQELSKFVDKVSLKAWLSMKQFSWF